MQINSAEAESTERGSQVSVSRPPVERSELTQCAECLESLLSSRDRRAVERRVGGYEEAEAHATRVSVCSQAEQRAGRATSSLGGRYCPLRAFASRTAAAARALKSHTSSSRAVSSDKL